MEFLKVEYGSTGRQILIAEIQGGGVLGIDMMQGKGRPGLYKNWQKPKGTQDR